MGAVDLRDVDLLSLLAGETHLHRVARTKGGEYAGPCPFCGGDDRFRVWPQHPDGRGEWWCRQCGRQGDAIDYLRQHDGLTYAEALGQLDVARAGGRPGGPPRMPSPSSPTRTEPPNDTWQEAAWGFVERSQASLWASSGARALDWLRRRGLRDETIRTAGLGYNSIDCREGWKRWGLEPREGTSGVWLPRGIVIPWDVGSVLWRVNIRRSAGVPKYMAPAGCSNALYNADALTADRPAMITEGELDALTVNQEAGDLVVAVASGSTGGARRIRWIAALAVCARVLVSFDAELDKGDKAAQFWVEVLQNATRWRPYWQDANAMLQEGANVRAWVAAGLTDIGSPRVGRKPSSSVRLPLTMSDTEEDRWAD